jgi:hypothetical protein
LVAYHDLDGRPAFKMAMQVVDDRWYLYLAHLWDRGWSILDVTEPFHPELVRFVEGPDNSMTIQVQVSHGLMLTALERPIAELLKHAPWEGFAWLLWKTLTSAAEGTDSKKSPAWNVHRSARQHRVAGPSSTGGGGRPRRACALEPVPSTVARRLLRAETPARDRATRSSILLPRGFPRGFRRRLTEGAHGQ